MEHPEREWAMNVLREWAKDDETAPEDLRPVKASAGGEGEAHGAEEAR